MKINLHYLAPLACTKSSLKEDFLQLSYYILLSVIQSHLLIQFSKIITVTGLLSEVN